MLLSAKVRTKFCKSLKYDCLLLFVISSMPKEHYLAIKMCTLMANVSKHTLNIEHFLRLLGACLGHACIHPHCKCELPFAPCQCPDSCSIYNIFIAAIFLEVYASIRKHSMQCRWKNVVCIPMLVVEPLTHFAVQFSHQKQHPQNSLTSLQSMPQSLESISHADSAIQQSSLNKSFTSTITIDPISQPDQPSKFSRSTFQCESKTYFILF